MSSLHNNWLTCVKGEFEQCDRNFFEINFLTTLQRNMIELLWTLTLSGNQVVRKKAAYKKKANLRILFDCAKTFLESNCKMKMRLKRMKSRFQNDFFPKVALEKQEQTGYIESELRHFRVSKILEVKLWLISTSFNYIRLVQKVSQRNYLSSFWLASTSSFSRIWGPSGASFFIMVTRSGDNFLYAGCREK